MLSRGVGRDPRQSPAHGLALAAVLALLTVGLASGAWWARSEGYVPPSPNQWGCDDVGFERAGATSPPSFDELRAAGFSPYCARDFLGENWL